MQCRGLSAGGLLMDGGGLMGQWVDTQQCSGVFLQTVGHVKHQVLPWTTYFILFFLFLMSG